MSIDPKYIIAPSPQEYYVDKDTGLALVGGYIKFFSDVNRSTLKPVFVLSGDPPDYTFTELPNPLPLSAVGTPIYLNNDIKPVLYPYNEEGELELYYLEVYSSENVLQFTRAGWPLISDGGAVANENDAFNYIPNGQFLLHNNISAQLDTGVEAGEITGPETAIAPGGWYFIRPETTTSQDFVTFYNYPQFVTDPTTSPRFAARIRCTAPNSPDATKDLRIRFSDVNKFASEANEFTFGFAGITFSSGDFEVSMQVIKYFGTGGGPSPTEITEIEEFTITDEQQFFQKAFVFGSNEPFNIGTNGDSYVEIAISFPKNVAFGCDLTNFVLQSGNVIIPSFPTQTDKDFLARSLVPPVLDPNGNDYGLPVVYTKEGAGVDRGAVGEIIPSISTATSLPYAHLCDGKQIYTAGFQENGIPNRRLFDVLLSQQVHQIIPRFGTGRGFLSGQDINIPDSLVILGNNSAGAVSATVDGAVPTGFTFRRAHIGTTAFGVSSFSQVAAPGLDRFIIWNNAVGAVANPGMGTSGFSLAQIFRSGSPKAQFIYSIGTVSAAGLAGTYFTFDTPAANYYVWFTVNGAGADPSIGGRTGIRINLASTDGVDSVAVQIAMALNGSEVTAVNTVAGSSVTAGSYFNFNVTGTGGHPTEFYVWYKVNNSGADPLVPGRIGILVNIASSNSADEVRRTTLVAINSTYFAVPDFRGQSLRGLDPNAAYDKGFRFSKFAPGIVGMQIGSFQLDDFGYHHHSIPNGIPTTYGVTTLVTSPTNNWDDSTLGGDFQTTALPTETNYTSQNAYAQSGLETVPYNAAVNFFIKY